MRTFILGLSLAASLSFAGAGSSASTSNHTVNFYQPATVNGTEFKPGEVKVCVENGKVTLKQGKKTAELKARVEENSAKFQASSVSVDGDTRNLQEIRIGGTNTKLVFGDAPKAGAVADNE